MTNKIFRGICTVTLVSVLLALFIIIGISYSYFDDRLTTELCSEARYVSAGVEQDGLAYLESLPEGGTRITWIGADGTVTEIGLTVVKVKNWDNTIANLPTYALVSDSYINWRGMYESNARRIMRHVLIDVNSVKFCDDAFLKKLSSIPALSEFISNIIKNNQDPNNPYSRLTNSGLFRKYLELYIENNPRTVTSMVHFVRQLQPTENGLPLELYFFTTTEWVDYEKIQSDTASAPLFDIRIFQVESDAANAPDGV